jgi:WD40 repeat protein
VSGNTVQLISTVRRSTLEAFVRALQRESHVLSRQPDLVWQQLYNRLQWEDEPLPSLLAPQLARRSAPGAAPWLRTRTPFPESEALVRTLRHPGGVDDCAISPDSSFIVSSSRDTLKIWDARTGEERTAIRGRYVSWISPDSSFIVTSGLGTLTVHDAVTGRERVNRRGSGCAISPDSSFIVSACDNTLEIWDAATGAERGTLKGFDHDIADWAVSPDGAFIVSAAATALPVLGRPLAGGDLRIWDAASGAEHLRIGSPSLACAISPDNAFVVSTDGHDLKIWNAFTSQVRATLRVSGVPKCLVSPDGSFVASQTGWGALTIWGASSGTERATLRHRSPVTEYAIAPDGSSIVSVCEDRILRIWDAETGQERAALMGHGSRVGVFGLSAAFIVSGGWDDYLRVWDATKAQEEGSTPSVHKTGHTGSCAISPDGSFFVSAGGDLRIWDTATGGLQATLNEAVELRACAISPDRAIMSTSLISLKIWDAADRAERITLTESSFAISACAISPDGRSIVLARNAPRGNTTLKIWDAVSGRERCALEGHTGSVVACAFSPDGSFVVSASSDKTLRISDARNGKERAVLRGHRNAVGHCVISPDGSIAVSSAYYDEPRIWDIARGRERSTLHQREATECAISLDGSFIVSCGFEGDDAILKIWDTASGLERSTLRGHTGRVVFAISPDGSFVVSAASDQTLRLWDAVSARERGTLFFP